MQRKSISSKRQPTLDVRLRRLELVLNLVFLQPVSVSGDHLRTFKTSSTILWEVIELADDVVFLLLDDPRIGDMDMLLEIITKE